MVCANEEGMLIARLDRTHTFLVVHPVVVDFVLLSKLMLAWTPVVTANVSAKTV